MPLFAIKRVSEGWFWVAWQSSAEYWAWTRTSALANHQGVAATLVDAQNKVRDAVGESAQRTFTICADNAYERMRNWRSSTPERPLVGHHAPQSCIRPVGDELPTAQPSRAAQLARREMSPWRVKPGGQATPETDPDSGGKALAVRHSGLSMMREREVVADALVVYSYEVLTGRMRNIDPIDDTLISENESGAVVVIVYNRRKHSLRRIRQLVLRIRQEALDGSRD